MNLKFIREASLLITGLLLITTMGCSGLVGSGKVIDEKRDVSGFQKIKFSCSANLHIEPGSTQTLLIKAEDNIVPVIKTEIRNDTLEIYFEVPGLPMVSNTKPVEIYVTVTGLKGLNISGSGKVDIIGLHTTQFILDVSGSGDVNLDKVAIGNLQVQLSGSGKAVAKGTAVTQVVTLSGSGKYWAPDLKTDTCNIMISGSGDAKVNADKELKVDISGSGSVRYSGNPEVTKNVTGSGSVTKGD